MGATTKTKPKKAEEVQRVPGLDGALAQVDQERLRAVEQLDNLEFEIGTLRHELRGIERELAQAEEKEGPTRATYSDWIASKAGLDEEQPDQISLQRLRALSGVPADIAVLSDEITTLRWRRDVTQQAIERKSKAAASLRTRWGASLTASSKAFVAAVERSARELLPEVRAAGQKAVETALRQHSAAHVPGQYQLSAEDLARSVWMRTAGALGDRHGPGVSQALLLLLADSGEAVC